MVPPAHQHQHQHQQTLMIDLTEDECLALLDRCELGRLAVVVEGRPEIFPVSHVFDETLRRVVFSSSDGTKLRAGLAWPWVAYEVDGVEETEDEGWSVLIVGSLEEIHDAATLTRVSANRIALWAAGDGTRWFRVEPTKMTGRRIRAVVNLTTREAIAPPDPTALPGQTAPGPTAPGSTMGEAGLTVPDGHAYR